MVLFTKPIVSLASKLTPLFKKKEEEPTKVEAKQTKEQGLTPLRFASKAATTAARLSLDAIRFTSDYISRQPGTTAALITQNPAVMALSRNINKNATVTNLWKNTYGKAVTFLPELASKGLNKIEETKYIQPSEEWKSASLKDKFTRPHIKETFFNVGSDVVGSLGVYALNPSVGMIIVAGATAQDVKETAREYGADEDYSDRLAIGTGLIVASLDRIVPDELFPAGAKKEFIGGLTRRLTRGALDASITAGKEAATEMIQEDIQIAAEATLRDDIGLDEVITRNVLAGFSGFLGGGGGKAVVDTYNTINSGYFKQRMLEQPIGFSTKDVSKIFTGFQDLSTRILEKLKGKDFVNRQYIQDLTNSPDVRQVEREVFRDVLNNTKGNTIVAQDLADQVKTSLLPLNTIDNADFARYESVTLPDEQRGDIQNYFETIYQSPIETGAGGVHFNRDEFPNYFAHTRIEDLADLVPVKRKYTIAELDAGVGVPMLGTMTGGTRRIIEVQSDLFQKGRLESEKDQWSIMQGDENRIALEQRLGGKEATERALAERAEEIAKLQPYRNTWWERIIREEIKRAAQDGKTKLQLPTGETAMKIEGLGEAEDIWLTNFEVTSRGYKSNHLESDMLEVGRAIVRQDSPGMGVSNVNNLDEWIITDVLGDGKFKAIPRQQLEKYSFQVSQDEAISRARSIRPDTIETFDISGKVDTSNPIYKFYEKDVQKFLKRFYDSKQVTDSNGVTWNEIDIDEKMGQEPVIAFMRNTGNTRFITRDQAVKVARAYIKRLKIDNAEITLADTILTDTGDAFASTFGHNLTFTEGLPQFAADHEMVHLIFRNFNKFDIFTKDGITKEDLLAEARERHPDVESEYELEEFIAQDFELFVEARINGTDTSFLGRLEAFFEKIYQLLKKMFSSVNESATRDFFNFVYESKQSAPVVLSEVDQTRFMKIDSDKIVVDFGEILAATKEKKDLVAVHNLSDKNLRFAYRFGGLVHPSLAIIDPSRGAFENFGNITLVGNKELVQKGETFAADVYSARFPRIEYKTEYGEYQKMQDELSEATDVLGEYSFDQDQPFESYALKYKFLKDQGIEPQVVMYEDRPSEVDTYKTKQSINDLLEGKEAAFEEYVQAFLDKHGTQQVVFSHFTKLGTRKTVPLTLENVEKIMKKEAITGSESFFYGLGSIRSRLMSQLRSISQIKAKKDKIVSSEEFERIKEKNDILFNEIIDEIGWEAAQDLGDFMVGQQKDWFMDYYKPSSELLNKIENLKDELRDAPTEYFEMKLRRPVMLNEFSYALVPENLDADTIQILNRNNIEVIKYAEGKRNDALKELQALLDTPFFKRNIDMSAEEVADLKEQRKQMLDDFMNSIEGESIKIQAETNAMLQERMNNGVVSGIKNNTYFRKEKTVKDAMGEGLLVRKNGRNVVIEASDREKYMGKGYDVVIEIGSLAAEAGFDTGYDYLEDQMAISELPTNARSMGEQELRRQSTVFNNIVNKLGSYKDAARGETVTRERYLTDVGKVKRTQWRRAKISAIQDFFGFSDADMRKVSPRDISRMTSRQFDQYMIDIEKRAVFFQEKLQKKVELIDLIQQREFQNYDALRAAMKLPPIDKMTNAQMGQFFKALLPYQKGDVFLPTRKMETVDRTRLEGIRTLREARERLAEDAGVGIEELQEIKVGTFDSFKGDVTLAESNPFYKVVIESVHGELARAEVELTQLENEFYEKIRAARKSRKRNLGDILVPQDALIMQWLEADDRRKIEVANQMTPGELDAAMFMRAEYKKAYDYLLEMHVLHSGIENYYTHIRRGFLETVREDGMIKAFKEIFKQQELDKLTFQIIDDDTGTILPLEKFFQYSLRRSGELEPSKNAARAFEAYFRSFYKKLALDAIVPLVDTYVYSLEPKRATPKGLQMDRTLKKFIYQWMNTKRGRPISYGGLIKPGGKIDSTLRFMRSLTTILDLGLNLTVGLVSILGEQTVTYKSEGTKKYFLGQTRARTKKGKALLDKYESLVGRSAFEELFLPSKDIGDKFLGGIMTLFRIASKSASDVWFLGALTKEEYDSGEVSKEKLAAVKMGMARYRPISEMRSLVGSTSFGQMLTQYKTWAIPVMSTTIKNWKSLASQAIKLDSGFFKSKALQEELRGVLVVTLVMLLASSLSELDDDTFLGKLKRKATNDALTVIQALRPSTLLSVPRLVTFISDLGTNLDALITLERYKQSGKLKGANGILRQFTPGSVKQFINTGGSSKKSGDLEFKIKSKTGGGATSKTGIMLDL